MAGGENGPPVLDGAQVVFPTKTRKELAADVLTRLGFIDLLAEPPKKTLLEIRTAITDTLGFPDPQTNIATRTLAQFRTTMMRRLGFAVQAASPPPGMADLLDSFTNEANQTIFRRLELDKGGTSLPAVMSSDSDSTSSAIDYVPILALAIGLAKAHYGQQDAKLYFEQVEKYLSDKVRSRPPNLTGILDNIIREAQQTAYRRYESGVDVWNLSPFTADADLTTIDYFPVQVLATGMAKAHFTQRDAEVYLQQYERYMKDVEMRCPTSARGIINQALSDAQRQLYQRYPMLRTEKWFSWALEVGERIYDVPKDGADTLNLLRVTWVGYQDDETWIPINQDIDPRRFTETQQGPPQAFTLRGNLVEIWPAPDAEYTLWLRGHIAERGFEADTDENTIDIGPLFLMALANCKSHFKQPDSGQIFRQLEVMLGRLTAGTHGLTRYVPNPPAPVKYDAPATMPFPRTTFERG